MGADTDRRGFLALLAGGAAALLPLAPEDVAAAPAPAQRLLLDEQRAMCMQVNGDFLPLDWLTMDVPHEQDYCWSAPSSYADVPNAYVGVPNAYVGVPNAYVSVRGDYAHKCLSSEVPEESFAEFMRMYRTMAMAVLPPQHPKRVDVRLIAHGVSMKAQMVQMNILDLAPPPPRIPLVGNLPTARKDAVLGRYSVQLLLAQDEAARG